MLRTTGDGPAARARQPVGSLQGAAAAAAAWRHCFVSHTCLTSHPTSSSMRRGIWVPWPGPDGMPICALSLRPHVYTSPCAGEPRSTLRPQQWQFQVMCCPAPRAGEHYQFTQSCATLHLACNADCMALPKAQRCPAPRDLERLRVGHVGRAAHAQLPVLVTPCVESRPATIRSHFVVGSQRHYPRFATSLLRPRARQTHRSPSRSHPRRC